jgi:type IV pilus assembly protein PilC
MLRSGLTATSALHLATEEAGKPKLRETLAAVTHSVEAGLPFSQALAGQKLFPPLAASIIASAEETGELADGCERIATSLEFWRQLRAKVVQSIVYPAIILILAVGVSILLVFFFLPKVEKFLRNAGRTLPPMTQALFDFTHFIQARWPWLVVIIMLLLGSLWLALRHKNARRVLELLAQNIPVFGRVLEAAVLARLTGLIAVLLRSGSDLVTCLRLGIGLTRVSIYRETLEQATEQLISGRSLRQSLDHPLIPRTVLGIVAAGEESGSLVRAFEELEKFYSHRLSTLVLTLVTLMEPALLICVGGVVAVVYISLFSAIMSITR